MTRVALLQLAALDGVAVPTAVDRIVDELCGLDADLVVLPEIWTPGYFAFEDYGRAADSFPQVVDTLSAAAKRGGFLLHAGSIVEAEGQSLYNTSLLISSNGDVLARYRKMHLFGYGSREQELLTPGDDVVTVDTELGRFGMAVCYDLRFPELFRRMVDEGAIGFLVASAWPFPRVEAWRTMISARAAENQAWLLAANGAGPATGAMLCGRSAIVDPWGVTVVSAGDEPATVGAEIDLTSAHEARYRFPALADRRLLADDRPTLLFERVGEPPLRFPVRRVVLAGYTGRDQEAVAAYIAKLAEEGIAPPDEAPSYFTVGAAQITGADHIDVLGDRTSGEAEFVLLVTGDDVYVAAGSDHTDRGLEEVSIPVAKQATPKVVSRRVWRLSEVADRWDELVLESRAPIGDADPYQRAELSAMLHPHDLLDRVRERFGPDLDGTAIFGGTVGGLRPGFAYADSFAVSITDPIGGDRLDVAYVVHDIRDGEPCP